jgi:hypothetical protein
MKLPRILGGHLNDNKITHLYNYSYLTKITPYIYVKIN